MSIDEKFPGFVNADRPANGLALIFDVSGFTNFFNKPDVQDYITDYINQVIDCVEICIWGGEAFWLLEDKELPELSILPSLRKFLGDGVLYVWEDDEEGKLKNSDTKTILLNRLWNIQNNMGMLNKLMMQYMPIADLPHTIKFGFAQGTVYKLTEGDGSIDYIGPCINMASRLVKYCSGINFIASSRLRLDKADITNNGYMKIIAKNLRSFEREIVIIDKEDYERLSPEEKDTLFEEIGES